MEFDLSDIQPSGQNEFILPHEDCGGMNQYMYNGLLSAVAISFMDNINISYLDSIIAVDIPARKIIIRDGSSLLQAILQATYVMYTYCKGVDTISSLHRGVINRQRERNLPDNLIKNPCVVL